MNIYGGKVAVLRIVLPLLINCCLITTAGAVTIAGQITPKQGDVPKVLLLKTYLNTTTADTIIVGVYGDFKVTVPYSFPVSCILQCGRSYFSFISAPGEEGTRIQLITDNGVLMKGEVEGSVENNAYLEFEALINSFDKTLVSHIRSNNPELGNYVQEYNAALADLQYKHKGTYTAVVMAHMRKIRVDADLQPKQNLRKNFFANVNFADSSVIGNAMLDNMLNFYANLLCDTTYAARKEFVSNMMKRTKLNGFVYRHTALEMFNTYLADTREELMQAYLDWFAEYADTVALPVLNVKTKMLRRVMPGQPAFDIAIVEDGKTLASLKQTAAQNKLTLLMIWESHCKHCREAIPQVKELYAMYHSKGFDVYGVSLDDNQAEWEAYIKEQDLQWKNILAMQSNGRIENYYVQKTPAFVLIDKSGTIVHRLIDMKGIQAYVKINLEQ